MPAKHMMTAHRIKCEFLVRVSRDLLDLEAELKQTEGKFDYGSL